MKMKTMAVGELKAHFSEVLEEVKQGHPITVGYGKKKEKIAVIVPYSQYQQAPRKLGVMEGRAEYTIHDGFKISDEEFISS